MSGRVPPSAWARVADVFERFTGRSATPWRRVRAPTYPKQAGLLGYCDAIEYTTLRDDGKGPEIQRYRHRFAKKDRPMICIGPDMKVFLLGGNYRMTELGIVDGSDKKHANAR